MISYELAKDLKDAGFPQLYEQGEYIEDPNAPDGETDGAYSPSLEEVIEACSKIWLYPSDNKLEFSLGLNWWGDSLGWHAGYWNDDWTDGPSGLGKTPLEAVCNLWLVTRQPQ